MKPYTLHELADLYDTFAGNRYSNACPFARIMEENLAQKLFQAGIRTLTPHQRELYPGSSQSKLQRLVQAAFSQRRKTLRNTLKPLLSAAQIEACDIDPGTRAERLSLAQFACLSRRYEAVQQEGGG